MREPAEGDGSPERLAVAPGPMEPGLEEDARSNLLELPLEMGRQPLALERRLLVINTQEIEPLWKRWLFLAVAIALVASFLLFTQSYWAPAHAGNNQNGYLVGAKNLATNATPGFEPSSPFEFVGWMWVMGDANSTAPGGGMHYPKYPLGFPLVGAIVYRTAESMYDQATAIEWVYRINPVATGLSLLGMFLIVRMLASSFAGLLSIILLGTCPLVLVLTNNPNSHALSLCFIVWGMYALLHWWRTGFWGIGIIAGFLLGYAVTIRYSEGLLLLPLTVAGLFLIRYRDASELSWWRIALWSTFAGLAVVVNDSFTATSLNWQRSLAGNFNSQLQWWHRMLLVSVPIVLSVRWNRIDRIFHRQTLRDAEWLRIIGCSIIVLAASLVSVPQLHAETPSALHAARLLALLVSFVAATVLLHVIPWRQLRSWWPSAALAVGWLVPVVALLVFNRLTIGSWTGYDSTNESSGFTWKHFTEKWRTTLDQLYNTGLYFILPLGLVGMLLAFRWSWRIALVLLLWFLPGSLLYMAYYYGQHMPLIGYLRFFTSMLPAAVIAAVWLIHRAGISTARSDAGRSPPGHTRGFGSISVPLAAGAFVLLPAMISVQNMLAPLERDFILASNLDDVARRVRHGVGENSIVFGHSQWLLNHLQFASSHTHTLYGSDYFRNGFPVPSLGRGDPDQPNPIQLARKQFLRKVYEGRGNAQMVEVQNQIMLDAFEKGRAVFAVLDSGQWAGFRRSFLAPSRFETRVVDHWTDVGRMSPEAMRTMASVGANVGGRGMPRRWYIVEIMLKQTADSGTVQQTLSAQGDD